MLVRHDDWEFYQISKMDLYHRLFSDFLGNPSALKKVCVKCFIFSKLSKRPNSQTFSTILLSSHRILVFVDQRNAVQRQVHLRIQLANFIIFWAVESAHWNDSSDHWPVDGASITPYGKNIPFKRFHIFSKFQSTQCTNVFDILRSSHEGLVLLIKWT